MKCFVCGGTTHPYLNRNDLCEHCYKNRKFRCIKCSRNLPFNQFSISERQRRTTCMKCISTRNSTEKASKTQQDSIQQQSHQKQPKKKARLSDETDSTTSASVSSQFVLTGKDLVDTSKYLDDIEVTGQTESNAVGLVERDSEKDRTPEVPSSYLDEEIIDTTVFRQQDDMEDGEIPITSKPRNDSTPTQTSTSNSGLQGTLFKPSNATKTPAPRPPLSPSARLMSTTVLSGSIPQLTPPARWPQIPLPTYNAVAPRTPVEIRNPLTKKTNVPRAPIIVHSLPGYMAVEQTEQVSSNSNSNSNSNSDSVSTNLDSIPQGTIRIFPSSTSASRTQIPASAPKIPASTPKISAPAPKIPAHPAPNPAPDPASTPQNDDPYIQFSNAFEKTVRKLYGSFATNEDLVQMDNVLKSMQARKLRHDAVRDLVVKFTSDIGRLILSNQSKESLSESCLERIDKLKIDFMATL